MWSRFSTSPPFHHLSSLSISMLLWLYFSCPCDLSNFLLSSSHPSLFPSHSSIFFLTISVSSLSFTSSSPTAFLLFFPVLLHPPPSLPPPCSVRDKFVEVDLKPVCKHCYERLPDDMKRRLAKRERNSKEKMKKLIPKCL